MASRAGVSPGTVGRIMAITRLTTGDGTRDEPWGRLVSFAVYDEPRGKAKEGRDRAVQPLVNTHSDRYSESVPPAVNETLAHGMKASCMSRPRWKREATIAVKAVLAVLVLWA